MILTYIIGGVGALVVLIIVTLAYKEVLDSHAAYIFILIVMIVTGPAIVFTLSKSQTGSCNQTTISAKNGVACSASKGKGK